MESHYSSGSLPPTAADAEKGPHHKMMEEVSVPDPDLPQNWPLYRKVNVSLAASGYAFVLLYGATAYTSGLKGVMQEFNVSMTKAILPFSLYIWGIFFAPIYSPHVSERLGRNIFYAASTLGLAAFTLGAAYSCTFAQLAVCRFFAGLCGGGNAVQIEGTFADVWPALYTNSYYSFIACAQYFGAATGAVLGWHVAPATSWRWTQYTTLMFALAALLLGLGMPETYQREIIRRRQKRAHQPNNLEPALSGVTLGEMARHTIINPLRMLVTTPLVTMMALYLALNFGVLFSWFISVPAVLTMVAGYTPPRVGSAFATAIGGTAAAALTAVVIDQVNVRILVRRGNSKGSSAAMNNLEHRLYVSIFGAALITASLFWIGWTANKQHKPYVPIVGNGVYVWGSAMNLIGFISYLFDAYPEQATLSALTTCACMRVAFAGIIPLCIITAIMDLGGMWALGTFGVISVVFLAFPVAILVFGKKWRMKAWARNEGRSNGVTPMHEANGMSGAK